MFLSDVRTYCLLTCFFLTVSGQFASMSMPVSAEGHPTSHKKADSTLPPPTITHESGFYKQPFYLGISHPDEDAVIYYTLDGSLPDQHASVFPDSLLMVDRSDMPNQISAIPTTGPYASESHQWHPPMDTVVKATNIRVKAIRPDGTASEAVTRTYWVGSDWHERYSLPVISISIDQDDLFGPEGIHRHYNARGIEWERPAHMAFFEPGGIQGFATDVGLRIHGGNSRRYALKSFRVYFRGRYGDREINYPLFPEQGEHAHERLILRNGASDWAFTYFRDPFAQSILKDFSEVERQSYRPAVVFVNGEYWGLTNIRERYDNNYVEHHYGYTEIDMLDNTGQVVYGNNRHHRELLDFLQHNDLQDPDNEAYVMTQMDVDNFIDYHILQVFSMNTDQPGKNVRFWRPQTPEGRWQWMWWDLDDSFWFGPHNPPDRNALVYSTGLDSISDPFVNAPTPPPAWAPNGPQQTFPLRALLSSTTFREAFIGRFADLLNTAFNPAFLSEMIDSFHALTHDYIYEHYRRWHRPEPQVNEQHVQALYDFAAARQHHMREHLVSFFGLKGLCSLHLDIASGQGHIRVNGIDIHESTPSLTAPVYPWEGLYFADIPIGLEAIPAEGHVFSHWEWQKDGADLVVDRESTIGVLMEQNHSVKAHFFENWPPELLATWSLLEAYAGADELSHEMKSVFKDPDSDSLTFTASSSHEHVAAVRIENEVLFVTPLSQGDAMITLTASDGYYPEVVFRFRVLVYPEPHDMREAPFVFDFWDANTPERVYPDHMIFLQSDVDDPGPFEPLLYPYHIAHDDYHANDDGSIGFPYNNTGRSRINGLFEDGISFINTGRSRDLGAALVAINTTGQDYVEVSWMASTIRENRRLYGIRLQSRIGTEGPFSDLKQEGEAVVYHVAEEGDEQHFSGITLPADLLNQPYVQLLWRYFHISGDSGPRAMLGLSDICVNNTPPLSADVILPDDQNIEVEVFPNPATDRFFVEFTNPKKDQTDLMLFNMAGELVQEKTVNETGSLSVAFHTESLPPGVYALVIRNDEIAATAPVVIGL